MNYSFRHEELLELNGMYSEMWNKQISNDTEPTLEVPS